MCSRYYIDPGMTEDISRVPEKNTEFANNRTAIHYRILTIFKV